MPDIAVALSVAALAGVVLLLFAWAWLLRSVRDLQRTLIHPGSTRILAADTESFPEFATGDRPTLVLVVDEHCMSCIERSMAFNRLAEGDSAADLNLVLLGGSQRIREWGHTDRVLVEVNSDLVGRLAVNVTPTLISFNRNGFEEGRRVAGDDRDLERAMVVSSAL